MFAFQFYTSISPAQNNFFFVDGRLPEIQSRSHAIAAILKIKPGNLGPGLK